MGPQLSGCVTSHVERASQGGSAVVKVSIIIFTPVGSYEVAQNLVSAGSMGWGSGGGVRHTQQLFRTEDYDQQSKIPHLHQEKEGGLVALLQGDEKPLENICRTCGGRCYISRFLLLVCPPFMFCKVVVCFYQLFRF